MGWGAGERQERKKEDRGGNKVGKENKNCKVSINKAMKHLNVSLIGCLIVKNLL